MRIRGRHQDEAVAPAPRREAYDEVVATVLVAAARIEPYQLDALRTGAPESPLAVEVIRAGIVTDDELTALIADHFGCGVVDFRHADPDPEVVELLTRERAHDLHVIPLAFTGEVVTVAVLDPSPEHLAIVAEALGHPVVPYMATQRTLAQALDSEYKATHEVGTHVQAFEARDLVRREALADVTQANEDAPVVQVVHKVITQGLRDRASDIHIEPFGERVRVRFRIDGALIDILDLPGSIGPALVSRLKILGGMNIVERRRPQDGQISMNVDGREVDIRVATTAVVGGEKVVMRLLDKSRPLFRLAQLGMPDDTADRFRRLVHQPYGMIVCAGPTGGGKTTTLYASLGELDTVERNIMTIEDPVEYTFDSINQIQINEQAGITFAGGLKSILRQDPDVILVGEIRDVDTARIAVQSALTGHMVLSSVHATEAVSALYRLLDMGIEAFLVASSVSAVMAQRLVRRNCTSCLEPYEPSADERGFLASVGGENPVNGFVRGVGCHFCAHTGFLDRIGVYELLTVTDEVRERIVDHVPQDEMRKLARSQGMRTLQEQGARLVAEGITTPAEVMRSIYVAGA